MNKHRPGINEANLVVRRLQTGGMKPSVIESVIQDIDKLFGVDCAFYDTDSCILTLAYDASRARIDFVEDVLISHGVDLRNRTWTKPGRKLFLP